MTSNVELTLRGPMSRYGYRGRVFIKDTPLEVPAELAETLTTSKTTVARFEQQIVQAAEGPAKKGRRKGATPRLVINGPGGQTVDGKDKAWTVGNFKTKVEAAAYARDVHGVKLNTTFALKTLNNVAVTLHKRHQQGLEGPALWGNLRGVILPEGYVPAPTVPPAPKPVTAKEAAPAAPNPDKGTVDVPVTI